MEVCLFFVFFMWDGNLYGMGTTNRFFRGVIAVLYFSRMGGFGFGLAHGFGFSSLLVCLFHSLETCCIAGRYPVGVFGIRLDVCSFFAKYARCIWTAEPFSEVKKILYFLCLPLKLSTG